MMSQRRRMLNNIEQSYINDGLILRLDGIDNTRSGHSATTTVWEDLSGNNYDFALVGVTKNGDNMYFTGSNSYAFRAALSNIAIVEIVLKTAATSSVMFIAQFANSVDKILATYNSNTALVIKHALQSFVVSSPLTNINGYSIDYSNYMLYQNNASITTRGNSDTWSSLSGATIGVRSTANTAYNFTGNIYSVRIYNRNLTVNEIAQNYAIDRKRFGF